MDSPYGLNQDIHEVHIFGKGSQGPLESSLELWNGRFTDFKGYFLGKA